MVEIRTATPADIPALIAMGRELHAESPRYARLSFNADKVALVAKSTIDSGGTHVALKDGMIVGFIAGFVCPHWFSDDLMASDFSFYIRPEHRRTGRIALRLLQAFEAWAIGKGAKDLVPGTSTQIDAEGTGKFFQKLGYEVSGTGFYKRVG